MTSRPRNCFLGGMTALLCMAGAIGAAEDDTRPNILFIYTDDHSYRTVGCYPDAYPWVKTPTIDNLHESGRLRAVRVGRENRWKPSAVLEYVESLEPEKG